MYGINFKDNKKNALNFLNDFGNPFLKNGVDKDGSISINLGAYGVPETILIDKNKKILLKYIVIFASGRRSGAVGAAPSFLRKWPQARGS